MLPEEKTNQIRKYLDESKNPLFFFDDDPDGLSSFLLIYRYKQEGKGIIVKNKPMLTEEFADQIDRYEPDIAFVLDKPMITDEFIDRVKIPIVWIDHHEPQKPRGTKYFNPRNYDDADNASTSRLVYDVVKQDVWIAMVGAVGDWQLPDFRTKFSKEYPKLWKKGIRKPEDGLFGTRLGELIKIFSFLLKGKTSDVLKCVKILTRIQDPEEILSQTTPQGKFIWKFVQPQFKEYNALLERSKKECGKKDKILLFIYNEANSYTKDLSNELLYLYPDKMIIVGRKRSGEVKMSLRSKNLDIPKLLDKALEGVEGYGGGHEHACGSCVNEQDFETFLKQLEEQL